MRRSAAANAARGAWRLAACAWLMAASAGAFAVQPSSLAMQSGPLIQLIDADERDDHTNILIQFACTVRYLNNMPASHGTDTRITLRLGPDCGSLLGNVPPEFPQIGGGAELVRQARLESTVPGEVVLELGWSREMDFVLAPTSNGTGLRVRLFTVEHRRASGAVLEAQNVEGYVVNLESSQQKFARDAIVGAAEAFKTQAFESEIDIDSEHWYRLRLGPFSTRAEAERVLNAALGNYPRAWVTVYDEEGELVASERAGTPSAAAVAAADPALPDAERAKVLADAKGTLEKRQYPEAIELLSRLVRQPEYPDRAQAQELLGLARERAGQMAQAKAEYSAYLQRYPQGEGAERVRRRLQALVASSIPARPFEGGQAQNNPWTVVGSAAVGYQYGRSQTVAAGTTTNTPALSAALVYGDLLVRDRGTRYDFIGRFDAGYTRNSADTVGGSQDRTTAAFAELTDRSLGLTGRIGRQTLASQGIIGLFDGLSMGYQINSHFTVGAAAGYPAYSSYSGFSPHQQFATANAEYSPFLSLVVDAYLFNETEQGFTDRRSVGFQTRYSRPGYTAIALVDYDVYFNKLNSATLIGNLRVGEYWIFGVNLDHRHSPLLESNNALIGQNQSDLRALRSVYTPQEIKQLAIDRTAMSDTLSLSVSRPLGERWQVMADIAALRLGSTPATDGVPSTPSTGLDKNASLQMAGSSLVRASDLHIFGVRVDDSPLSRSTTLSWDARFPVGGAWRFGPRFSVARINDAELGGKQTLYLPEVRADWTSRRSVFEMIAGYQLQTQQALQQLANQNGPPEASPLEQRTLYVSSTYRIRF